MTSSDSTTRNPKSIGTTPSQLKRKWTALLAATIETWTHQLLYVRQVYPRDIFTFTRFLGIRCYVCPHPGVLSYINNTLRAAIPAIVSGVADEISFHVTDYQNAENDGCAEVDKKNELIINEDMETFIIRISNLTKEFYLDEEANDDNNIAIKNKHFSNLEKAMRDLILRVHSLESTKDDLILEWSDSVSFKLSLHIPEENKTCMELNQVFAEGKWRTSGTYNSSPSISLSTEARQVGTVIRPLHHITTSMATFQFVMRKTSRTQKQNITCIK